MKQLIDWIALLTISIQVTFLILKLAQVGLITDWSWWWVFAPAWGSVALLIAAMLGAYCISSIVRFGRWRTHRRALARELKGDM